MKQTINFNDFYNAFQEVRPDNFSYEGLRALFYWLEDLADDTGEEIELDVIGLCCNFSEYESLEELQESYPTIQSIEELHDETIVIESDGGSLIVQIF